MPAKPLRERAELYGLSADGRLLGSRYKDTGAFGVFGGGIDPGETPEQAAIREFNEESGWTASNPRRLPVRPLDIIWGEPTTAKQRARSKDYSGSRTYYVLADITGGRPGAPIPDPSSDRDPPSLFDLQQALALSSPADTKDKNLQRANARRRSVLIHLTRQLSKGRQMPMTAKTARAWSSFSKKYASVTGGGLTPSNAQLAPGAASGNPLRGLAKAPLPATAQGVQQAQQQIMPPANNTAPTAAPAPPAPAPGAQQPPPTGAQPGFDPVAMFNNWMSMWRQAPSR